MELRSTNPWNGDTGPRHDVVMSCRVRLARNLAGFPFVNRASVRECEQVLSGAGHRRARVLHSRESGSF